MATRKTTSRKMKRGAAGAKATPKKKASARKTGARGPARKAAARSTGASARARGVTVDDYIARFKGKVGEVASGIRTLVRETVPEAIESIKWGQPVWESNGPIAYLRAFKDKVNLGFWRGADLEDPDGHLQGSGNRMRHLKLVSLQDLRPDKIRAFLKRAVELNKQKGDPTKRRRA